MSATGAAPDRFLVGLAVLSLFSEAAEERPLLCVVDDAQWVDQASALTLAFVARRLLAEPVGIVFAAREPGDELRHLSELEVHGLRDGDARALLASEVPSMLDERVRDRIIAETRGNPLALLELPRGLTRDGDGRRLRDAGRAGAVAAGSRRATSDGSRPSPRTRGVCCSSRRPSRSAIRCSCWRASERLGIDGRRGRRDGRAAGARRAGDVPSSAGALGGVPVRRSGRAPSGPSGVGGGDGSRASIRIVAHGIWPRRRRDPMRRSRWSWSAPPAGRRRAAASPPRPRSCSARSR